MQQVIFIISVTCVHVNTRAHSVQTCFIMSEAEREVLLSVTSRTTRNSASFKKEKKTKTCKLLSEPFKRSPQPSGTCCNLP